MRPRLGAFFFFLGSAACLALLWPDAVHGQQILQYGFEARGPVWKPGSTDTASKVLKHELTDETRHSGQRCEHIQLQVERGTYIHYTYDLPQAPITVELNVSLYLKSNRPGIQLLCRVVLPREKDPANLGRPMTMFVRCEPYEGTRWKLVKLRQPVKRLQEQQQLLAHKLGRDVITEGAYIDQLVLNLYDGPGQTDVWIDDLEAGPVLDSRPVARPQPNATPGAIASSRRTTEVQLRSNQLLVSGKPFLMRGIRYTGTPLKTLHEAGFNTIWLDETTPPNVIEDATNLGFWIVPSIHAPVPTAGGPTGRLASRAGDSPTGGGEEFAQKVAQFTAYDSVLAWDLGGNLDAESFTGVTRFARAFRNADQQQPVIADVWDGYRGYSRSIEQVMLGTHRWPLMTSLELDKYREWLVQRRRLSTDNYSWTWIQTHMPDWFAHLAYPGEGKNGFSEAVGPQPEQIRLLAYVALAAGYRGLSFWSDRFLVDSHQGRDRLLAMALLNQELQILERILAEATRPPEWVPAIKQKDVMAAVFRTRLGVLVLPIWMGAGSQYVPGQGSVPELAVTAPGVPVTATAWEVSPGRIKALPIKRELGGTTVFIHNFSLTSAVLFTADLSPKGMVVYLQNQQRNVGPLATQWLHDQAQDEFNKVERVQAELDRLDHSVVDAGAILDKTRQALKLCMQFRRNGEHVQAYGQAETALRSLRTLMRADYDRAVRDLDVPASSPYAVSFYTLPKHWQMLDRMKQMKATPTVLADGGFETPADKVQVGWTVRETPSLDPVTVTVRRVSEFPHTGKQCLMMKVEGRDKLRPLPVLERTFVSLHSPTVRLPPGTLVRISAWARTTAITGSVDGAQFYDSIGGEPLAVRLTAPWVWKRYSLYREVPASGMVSVTLALSGLGTVYFDDVRIEPLGPSGEKPVLPAAPDAGRRWSASPGANPGRNREGLARLFPGKTVP